MPAARLCRVAGRDTWHVYHERRRISTGETDRAAAERFLADYLDAAAAPARPDAETVEHLLARYLADRRARGKPGAERLGWAHKQLNRHMATTLPDRVDPPAYTVARAAEGVKPGTVRTELQALRAALRWAGVAGEVVMPDRPPARQRWLTREEAAGLSAACNRRHVRLFVLLALHTAARRGAVLGLTWDRVDLDRRVIDYRDPGLRVSRKRRVVVPINETLLPVLTDAKARAATPFVIEWAGGRVESVKHAFRDACDRAGLEGVTPHVLRHTAVTWMMQRGVPAWQVAGFAGMTLEVLQDVYGHHHPEHLADAAAALG
jgi:integrase